ncbi:uncharacterized protein BDCG_16993, partial [Blastomyces dermatitidis ER-3]
SSYIDRFIFINDSKLNIESLIKNLKNMIMKKLFISCVTESSMSSLISSAASFSAASFSVSFSVTSQSSTLVSVSGSPTPATPVPAIPTLTTSCFTISVFVTSSSHFKKMLHRLSESHFSRIILLFNSVKII